MHSYMLICRRSVHDILAQLGIDQPKYAIIDRDKNSPNRKYIIHKYVKFLFNIKICIYTRIGSFHKQTH